MHKVFPRNTQRSVRIVFKTAAYQGSLYKRSPYFVGSNLWDAFSVNDIELPDVFEFKSRLKKMNRVYVDLLSRPRNG